MGSVRLNRNVNHRSTEITLARKRIVFFTCDALIALSGSLSFDTWQRHQRCVAALKQQACRDS
jgi:hypothetical protein